MKTKAFLLIFFFSLIASSCEKGTTELRLNGDEQKLPDELKGLKVYNVSISGWSDVKVAILNNEINSLTYPVGKTTQTTIILNKDHYNERTIEADKILFENDEMILIKKK
jgi:hypothetical protein